MALYDSPGILDPRDELVANNPELQIRPRANIPCHLDVETTTLLMQDAKLQMPLPVLLRRMNDLLNSTKDTEVNQGYAIAVQLLPYFTSKAPVADAKLRDKEGEDVEVQKAQDKINQLIQQSNLDEDTKRVLVKAKVVPFQKS